MARVGGRSLWLAWPIGMVCAAVVAALVWLAAPGVPGAIDFIGSTLRGASSAAAAEEEPQRDAGRGTDCRDVYPDALWAELVWTPDVLLSQNTARPAATPSLVTALAPQVRLSCTWRAGDGRSASTTIADVASDAAVVAQTVLTSEGFTCAGQDDGVHCERTGADITEIHDLRNGVWVSTVLTGWVLPGYAAQVASRVF